MDNLHTLLEPYSYMTGKTKHVNKQQLGDNGPDSEAGPSVIVVGGEKKKADQRRHGGALVSLMDNCSRLAFGKRPNVGASQRTNHFP